MSQAFVDAVSRLSSALDRDDIPWKNLVQALLVTVYAFETGLQLRQHAHYSPKRHPSPPSILQSHISQETFAKSQAYGRAKSQFALVSGLYAQLITAAIIHFDIYAHVWAASQHFLNTDGFHRLPFSLPKGEIAVSIAWTIGMFVVRELPSLPLTYYQHFVLEEAHGFNKMTRTLFISDTLKQWAIGLVIGCPLIGAVVGIIRWAGPNFVAYVCGFLLVFQIVAQIAYPTIIQPLFNTLTPLPDGPLKLRIEKLASALKFPLKSLHVVDGSKRSSHSNAYFSGLPFSKKFIVIFDSLICQARHDEIEAVLAHELGHWAHRDPTKLLLLAQATVLVNFGLFSFFIQNASLYSAFGFQLAPTSSPLLNKVLNKAVPAFSSTPAIAITEYLPVIVGLELFQLVLGPMDALIKFLMNSAVRRMEFAADRFAAELARPKLPPAELAQAAASATAPVKTATAGKDGDGSATDRASSPSSGEDEEEDTAAQLAARASTNGAAKGTGADGEQSVSAKALIKATELDESERDDPECLTPYAKLLGQALIRLHVENLSTIYYDSLYSAWNHSHPTLLERLNALQPFVQKAEKAQ
ncbi:zinc metalloprotease [Tilletia horrida]|uniref:Ste24 endopeptidase n=1 Tax=Tilletia horrida TaxID=155126 RepID=A0AAN6GKL0_9BASI|nr:zinc metalloprotease [Tilletia horrida]